MSSKNGKVKGKKVDSPVKKQPISRSARAGITFPVGRIHRHLRKGNYAERIGGAASVYLAAVLEYLVAELLELGGQAAADNKKARIIPRHLKLAVSNDDELQKLLQDVTFADAGIRPNIESVLLPKKTKKTEKKEKYDNE